MSTATTETHIGRHASAAIAETHIGRHATFARGKKTFNGTIRYVGETEFAEGVWVGIELAVPKGSG